MAPVVAELSFAEKQLAKFGWKEGMGLGKNNDGIAKALQVKARVNKLGIGHDSRTEHHHWWDFAYNRAVANIKVTNNEKDGSVVLSSSDVCSINKERPNLFKSELLYENFIQDGCLVGSKMINSNEDDAINDNPSKPSMSESSDSDSSNDEDEREARSSKLGHGLLLDMTDAQLFKLCGGGTAHKGARHGIRMTGKMKRLQDLEKKAVRTEIVFKEPLQFTIAKSTIEPLSAAKQLDDRVRRALDKTAAIGFVYSRDDIEPKVSKSAVAEETEVGRLENTKVEEHEPANEEDNKRKKKKDKKQKSKAIHSHDGSVEKERYCEAGTENGQQENASAEDELQPANEEDVKRKKKKDKKRKRAALERLSDESIESNEVKATVENDDSEREADHSTARDSTEICSDIGLSTKKDKKKKRKDKSSTGEDAFSSSKITNEECVVVVDDIINCETVEKKKRREKKHKNTGSVPIIEIVNLTEDNPVTAEKRKRKLVEETEVIEVDDSPEKKRKKKSKKISPDMKEV